MAEAAKRDRIGLASMIFLPVVALFFDIIAFIPGVNSFGWIVLGLWLFILGVSPFSIRRLATIGTSLVIGFVPGLNLLPEITAAIIVIIIMVKSEDRLGLKLPLGK